MDVTPKREKVIKASNTIILNENKTNCCFSFNTCGFASLS